MNRVADSLSWPSPIALGRFRRLGREFFWIILGQVGAVIGAIVGVRLLTGLLSPAAYGELALGMTLVTLVQQVILGPLGNGVTRFYAPAVEQGDLGGYLNVVRRMMLSATAMIVLMTVFGIVGLLIARRTEWIPITAVAALLAILSGYNSTLSGIQNAARQRSVVALHQGMESWARYLVAAGLLLWLGGTSSIAMLGYAVAVILVLGSQFMFFRRIASSHTIAGGAEKGWQEQIWKYSWPFAIFGMFTWAQLASDRWALGLFATTKAVGLYAVLFQLGYYPISMATGLVMQFLAPIFYQRAGDASDRERNADVHKLSWRLTWLILSMTGASFMVALLFHSQIFRVLVAREYQGVSHLLPWVMLGGGVFAAGQSLALNLMSQLKTRAMMVAKVVTALFGVALNFAGAYWYGTKGIVFAGILFAVSYSLWMAVLSRREVTEKSY